MNDYRTYSTELRSTTLFQDMSDEEILTVLEAMQPPIKIGRDDLPDLDGRITRFRMVVRRDPPCEPAPIRFKYSMPAFGDPGMLMGEIPALSCKDQFLKRTDARIKPPLPKMDFAVETLEFTPEMITGCYGAEVEPAQHKMLRNLLGMLAQKVTDVRRELYLARSGSDIYAESNAADAGPAPQQEPTRPPREED